MNFFQAYSLFFIVFFVGYLGIKSVLFRKQFNVDPLAFLKGGFVEKIRWCVFFGLNIPYAILIIIFVMDISFLKIDLLHASSYSGVGVLLTLLGLGVMTKAHFDMGSLWRMGLDNSTDRIVQEGLFKVSRNPVYMGVLLIIGGMMFILQTLVAVMLFLFGVSVVLLIVRSEESFLEDKFKQSYLEYKKKVPRFI